MEIQKSIRMLQETEADFQAPSPAITLLDLAAYSIVAENNAGQYYPDYAYNHPLFTPGMHVYSDSKVSSFLNSISDDRRIEFLNEWNARCDHREKIYISCDSANKSCKAGDISWLSSGITR